MQRLADTLGVTAATLLTPSPSDTTSARDDRVVEAALQSSPTFLRADELSRGLNWELARTHRALSQLRRRLAGTGLDLRRTSNGYALIARTELLSRRQQRSLERARLDRRDLNITATRLLYQIYSKTLSGRGENLSNNERVALASLLKTGLVHRRDGRLEPTDAVCASLPPSHNEAPRWSVR